MKNIILLLCFLLSSVLIAEENNVEIKLSRREKRELSYLMWHQNHREIFQNNKKYIKRLERKYTEGKIVGLELIVASPTQIRIESRWGHAMLRFVDSEAQAGDDVVLGFVAMLDSPVTEHVKGLLGYYPVFPVLKSLRLFNNQYVKQEDRPLDRHILVTDKKIHNQAVTKTLAIWSYLEKLDQQEYKRSTERYKRKAIKRANKKWGNKGKVEEVTQPETGEILGFIISSSDNEEDYETVAIRYRPVGHPQLGGYTFLSNNCAGALVNFSNNTGITHKDALGISGRIPVKLPTFFNKALRTPYPELKGEGLSDLKMDLVKLLNLEKVDNLAKHDMWPENATDLISTKYDLTTKMKILDAFDDLIPDKIREELIRSLPPLSQRPNYNQIYKLNSHAQSLYTPCQDLKCIQDNELKAHNTFKQNVVEKKKEDLKKYMKSLSKKKFLKLIDNDKDYKQFLEMWTN